MNRLTLLLFLLCLLPLQAAAADFYRSNALGMKLERIGPFRTDEFEYVLRVEEDGSTESRTLLSGEEEIISWIVTRLSGGDILEVEVRGDEKITRERSDGRIVKETVETGGSLEEIRLYIYDEKGLAGKEVSDAEGLLYTDRFERTEEGRLRRAVREFPGGATVVSSYAAGDAGLAEEVHSSGEERTRFRYKGGLLVSEENWSGDELVNRIDYFPGENYSRETDVAAGVVTTREYDEDARIIRETVEGDHTWEIREYIYRGDTVDTEIRRTPGVLERWNYEYDHDGRRTAFDYYRGGILIKRREFETEENYKDIVMRGGKPLLIVYYRGHVQVKSEYIPEGGGAEEKEPE